MKNGSDDYTDQVVQEIKEKNKSLLRKGLEEFFREQEIIYLVQTLLLFSILILGVAGFYTLCTVLTVAYLWYTRWSQKQ